VQAYGALMRSNDQLTAALEKVVSDGLVGFWDEGFDIADSVYDAVVQGIKDGVAAIPAAQSGLDAVPKTGLYMLHEGEGVLTASENRVLGSYQTGTGLGFLETTGTRRRPPPMPEANEELLKYVKEYEAAMKAAAAASGEGADAAKDLADQMRALQGSINAAARTLAQFSDYLPTDEISRLASVLLQWSQTLGDVTQKAAAFTTGIQLWAKAIERTDDVMGELVSGGRGALDTIQSMVQAARAMDDADPGAKLDALTEAYNTVAGAAETMQDAVRASFNRQREALEESLDAFDGQQEAIDQQIRSLEDLKDATEEWAGVAESVADMLHDLRLSDLAPPDDMGQFRRAQSEFDAALAAFRAAPTPEGASRVQELAREVLDAASEVFTRPSPEYQALFASITESLEEVQRIAEEQGAGHEDYLRQIAELQAQSKALDVARNELEAETRIAIDTLNAQEQQALAAIQAAVAPELQALAAEMERVAVLAAVQATTITNQLDMLVRGVDLQTQMLGELQQIRSLVGGTPQYQAGGVVARTGLAFVHAGETVVPAGASAGGGGVVFNFGNMTVTGTREGAREFFKELEVLTERSMRFGTLNRIMKEETKR
jgi:hypothetical protein